MANLTRNQKSLSHEEQVELDLFRVSELPGEREAGELSAEREATELPSEHKAVLATPTGTDGNASFDNFDPNEPGASSHLRSLSADLKTQKNLTHLESQNSDARKGSPESRNSSTPYAAQDSFVEPNGSSIQPGSEPTRTPNLANGNHARQPPQKTGDIDQAKKNTSIVQVKAGDDQPEFIHNRVRTIGAWLKVRKWCNKHKTGVRWLLFCIVIGASVAIIIVVLNAKGKLPHQGHQAPVPTRTVDVMPNSGAVAIDLNDGSSHVTFFHQNGAGGIEESLYDGQDWTKQSPIPIPEDAQPRNGTPLMAAWYELEGTQEFFWQLYYIDRNNWLRDLKNSNKTNKWIPGSLGSHEYEASTSNTTGLTACASPWYGDPIGIRLYFGSASKGAIQEAIWSPLGDSWTLGYTFEDSNPDAGCECTRRDSSITNLWYINSQGTLQDHWYEFNPSTNSTHPVETWVAGNITHGPLKRNTAVTAIKFNDTINIIIQNENDTLAELIVSGNAELSTLSHVYQVTEEAFMENTKIACLVLNSTIESPFRTPDLHVWAQLKNDTGCNGVDEFVRPLGSEWWADGKFHAEGCS